MLFVSLQQQNDIKTNIDINGKFKWHLFCPGVKPIIDKIKLTQQVWNQSEVGGDFTFFKLNSKSWVTWVYR